MIRHHDPAHHWQWKGTWNEFVGRVKQSWGEMTDDDLGVQEGEFQEMLGRVQRKTGETMENIYEKLT